MNKHNKGSSVYRRWLVQQPIIQTSCDDCGEQDILLRLDYTGDDGNYQFGYYLGRCPHCKENLEEQDWDLQNPISGNVEGLYNEVWGQRELYQRKVINLSESMNNEQTS